MLSNLCSVPPARLTKTTCLLCSTQPGNTNLRINTYLALMDISPRGAHRFGMAQIALENVLPILQSFVGSTKADTTPSEADRLSDMGLDSLTTINVIVSAAETLGLDLERLEDITQAPATIGDILSILNRLGAAGGSLN